METNPTVHDVATTLIPDINSAYQGVALPSHSIPLSQVNTVRTMGNPENQVIEDGNIHSSVIAEDSPVSVCSGYVMDIIMTDNGPFVLRPNIDCPGIHQRSHRSTTEFFRLVYFIVRDQTG